MNEKYRVGTGFDIHRLAPARQLVLGGVRIAHDKGLLGHSDADVVAHAVIDGLLGALSLGDIGTHFPDTDLRYKNVDSMVLLKQVVVMVSQNGYRVNNIDITIQAEQPKLNPHITQIRGSLSTTLGIQADKVSVKAKTMEGLGAIGEGKAIAAQVSVLLEKV